MKLHGSVLLVLFVAAMLAAPIPVWGQDEENKPPPQEAKTKAQENDDETKQEDEGDEDKAEQSDEDSDGSNAESEGQQLDSTSGEGPSAPWNEAFRWRQLTPTVMSGRIVDVDVDPRNDAVIYAAAASGGLWKTINRGTTWQCVFDSYGTTSIGDIALDPSAPDTIWIGTGEANNQRSSYWGDGVYKSVDGGETWNHLGLVDTHHIGRIVVHPEDSNTVYVAALGHLYSENRERGVFRTKDGGESWEHVLNVGPKVGAVDLVIHPQNPDILIAATYERIRRAWDFDGNGPGSGIYRSEDGGTNWKRIEDSLPKGDIGRIGLDIFAGDGDTIFASVANQNQVKDDANLGEIKKNEDGTISLPLGMTVRIEDGNVVVTKVAQNGIAARARIAPKTIVTQIGAVEVATEEDLQTALDALRPGDRFQVGIKRGGEESTVRLALGAQVRREVGGEIYRSDDAGLTWEKVNKEPVGGSPAYYYGQIRIDPNDVDRLYMCSVPFYRSEDGGVTWKRDTATSVHVDHHAIWINPANSNQVLLGNDGGLHLTHDRCKTWDHFFNLPAAQFYTVSVDMQQPYHVYGGLQDNGSFGGPNLSRNPGGVLVSDWYRVGGGDGFYVCVDPTNPEIIISESQFGVIARMHRSTGERVGIRPPQSDPNGVPDRYNWNSPIVQSVHDSRVIYFAGNKLFRSYNHGDNWEVISPDLTTQDPVRLAGNVPHCTITTIAESPQRRNTLMVGTDDGLIHVTEDGGKTWNRVSDRLPFSPKSWWCSRAVLSKHDAKTAYVSFTGYREDDFRPFLFKTTDLGETWVEIKGDLPNEPINVVVEDPANAKVLYVGTELGVYVTIDGGESWKSFGQGLPRIAVHDLVIHPRDRDLVVGTHAKGFYIVDDITPLHEVEDKTLEEDVYLFEVMDAIKWLQIRKEGTSGNRKFASPNPTNGTIITYSLGKDFDKDKVKLEIYNEANEVVATLNAPSESGMHRVACPFGGSGRRGFGRGGRRGNSPLQTGQYYAVLTVDGDEYEQAFRVLPDPISATKQGVAR